MASQPQPWQRVASRPRRETLYDAEIICRQATYDEAASWLEAHSAQPAEHLAALRALKLAGRLWAPTQRACVPISTTGFLLNAKRTHSEPWPRDEWPLAPGRDLPVLMLRIYSAALSSSSVHGVISRVKTAPTGRRALPHELLTQGLPFNWRPGDPKITHIPFVQHPSISANIPHIMRPEVEFGYRLELILPLPSSTIQVDHADSTLPILP